MSQRDGFWKLEHLSNARLLASLGGILRTQRRTLAELVAHLGEVEARRIHLEAACSSMFSYCVGRLGMSEDEACRRIELARLARTFPVLFAELESGQITLSVALVLKPVLTPDNHRELFRAARGKSTQQARELVAERFPKPDVPASIRKLPECRPPVGAAPAPTSSPATLSFAAHPLAPCSTGASAPASTPLAPGSEACDALPPAEVFVTCVTSEAPDALPTAEAFRLSAAGDGPRALPAPRTASVPDDRGRIEPLSAQRYRIQFTADAELKRKLELARDLMRHAHPSGDFAGIVSRALELLVDDLQRRRFGARRRSATRAGGPSQQAASADPHASASQQAAASAHSDASPSQNVASSAASEATVHSNVSPRPKAPRPPCATPAAAVPSDPSPSPAPIAVEESRYIPCAARRAVLERDGLGCSWVDARGARCGSRAWLELDHRHPYGKGGSSDPDNVRLLCHAHNQLAAEHAYGRAHLERAARRRRSDSQHPGAPRRQERAPAPQTTTQQPP